MTTQRQSKAERVLEKVKAQGYLEAPIGSDRPLNDAWYAWCLEQRRPVVVVWTRSDGLAIVHAQLIHTTNPLMVQDLRGRVERIAQGYPGVSLEDHTDPPAVGAGPLKVAQARTFARRLVELNDRDMAA